MAAASPKKFTFELTPELREMMDEHPEINWSAVLRDAIRREVEAAEIAQEILDEQNDPRIRAIAQMLEEGAAERFARDVADARRR